MGCEICQRLNEKEDLIYETKYWKIFISDNQSTLGRAFVTLKRHCGDLAELKEEEILDFLKIIKELETAIKKSFNATMFNWSCLMNNAYKEDKPKPHIHWHVRPRYRKEVNFERLIFKDEEFGHHYDNKKTKEVSKEVREKIIDKLKKNL